MYMIYALSHAKLLVQLCLLIGLSDCRSTIKIYKDAFFIIYLLCTCINMFVMLSCLNFYYHEFFVTKLTLTFMKTDSCHLKLHSLIHFHFTLLRVMNVDSEVRSPGMVQSS